MNYQLHLDIINLEKEILASPIISIIQLKSNISKTVLFSTELDCYVAENLELGRIKITISHTGYDTQERYITISKPLEYIEITLGRENSKYFYLNSVLYPVSNFNNNITIRTSYIDEDFYNDISVICTQYLPSDLFSLYTNTENDDSLYFIEFDEIVTINTIKNLLAHLRSQYPELGIGPSTQTPNFKNSILLNTLTIEFSKRVNSSIIRNTLNNISYDSYEIIDDIYTLYFSNDTYLELLDTIFEINTLTGNIKISHTFSSAPPIPAMPNDTLWSAQWDKQVVNVDGAWDFLNEINPNQKYGNPEILICVIDNYIDIENKTFKHPDLEEYNNNKATATLSKDYLTTANQSIIKIILPTPMDLLSDGSYIVLIDQHQYPTIGKPKKGANEIFYTITTNFIPTPYKKETSITIDFISSTDTISYKGTFYEDYKIEDNILSLENITGTFYKDSFIIITNSSDNKSEYVKILDIKVENSITKITTSYLELSYPKGSRITQGNKLVYANSQNASDAKKKSPGHGTMVTSIIAASADNNIGIAGTAPNVKIKFLGNERIISWRVRDTLTLSKTEKYNDPINSISDAVNISLVTKQEAYNKSIKDMLSSDVVNKGRYRKGVAFVIAAGNDKSSESFSSHFANCETVISVGASSYIYEETDNLGNITYKPKRASYSNFSNIAGKKRGNDTKTKTGPLTICAPSADMKESFYLFYKNSLPVYAATTTANDEIFLNTLVPSYSLDQAVNPINANYFVVQESICPNDDIIKLADKGDLKMDDKIVFIPIDDEHSPIIHTVKKTDSFSRVTTYEKITQYIQIKNIPQDISFTTSALSSLEDGITTIYIALNQTSESSSLKEDLTGQNLNFIGSIIQIDSEWYTIKSQPQIVNSNILKITLEQRVEDIRHIQSKRALIPKTNYKFLIEKCRDIKIKSSKNDFKLNSELLIGTPGNIYHENTAIACKTLIVKIGEVTETGTGTETVTFTVTLTVTNFLGRYAIGTPIYSNIHKSFTDYASGTSSAAPQVSGAIALMLTANPDLTYQDIKNILISTATKIDPNNRDSINKWISHYEYNKIVTGIKDNTLNDNNQYYSDGFGFGQINVLAAVEKSIEYKEKGAKIQTKPESIPSLPIQPNDQSNSYNIYIKSGFNSNEILDQNYFTSTSSNNYNNYDYLEDNSIYIKVKNNAPLIDGISSHRAWVRVYLGLDSGSFSLGSVKNFQDNIDNAGYTAGHTGIYYLGEMDEIDPVEEPGGYLELFNRDNGYLGNTFGLHNEGGIPPQSSYIVHTKWKNTLLPPYNTPKHTYLIAEVLPYDGPIETDSMDERANTGYRRIFFTRIEMKEVQQSILAMARSVSIPTTEWPKLYEFNNTTSTIEKQFAISVSDWEYLIPKHIKIEFTGISIDNIENKVILSYNEVNDNYVLDETNNDNALENIVVNLSQYSNAEVDGVMTYFFNGNITFRKDYASYKIDIIVLEPAIGEVDYLNPTKDLEERYRKSFSTTIHGGASENTDLILAVKPRLHVFADMNKIEASTNIDESFTTDSINPSYIHHITTVFKAIDTNESVNAYAIMDSIVLVQEDSTNTKKVNLILKPLEQTGLGFTPVKYYIYRGLNKRDFLTMPSTIDLGGDIIPNTNNSSEFIQSLYTTLDQRNSDASSSTPDTLSPLALGIGIAGTELANISLDEVFANTNDSYQLPIVKQGMILGTFNSSSFGIEIILEDGSFIPTLDYARQSNYSLSIAETVDSIDQQIERAKILSFIDPAAFFGMHSFAGIFQRNTIDNNKVVIKKENVYEHVIAKFANKHKLYIDIRNDNNYPYNYFQNHTISTETIVDRVSNDQGLAALEISLNNANNFQRISLDNYHWPYFMLYNVESEDMDSAKLYLKLNPAADNPSPLLYIWNAPISTGRSKGRFIDTDLLLEENYMAKIIGLSLALAPNLDTNSTVQNFSASWLKLSLLKRPSMINDSYHRAANKATFHDQIFSPIQSILQKSEIVAVDTINRTFTINGEHAQYLASGDILYVSDSADSSNNKVYTLSSVQYNNNHQSIITIQEDIIGNTAPYGYLYFSKHLWNTNYPTQWFTTPNKSFVDSTNNTQLGFSYLANTGIAIEDDNIIFYTTPYDHFSRGDNRVIEKLNLVGGTSPMHSFWEVVLNNNDNFKINTIDLALADNSSIAVFEAEQCIPDTQLYRKENLLAICLTKSELTQIKKALFMSGLDYAHHVYLKLKISENRTDNNNIEYTSYEVWLAGWKKVSTQEGIDINYTEISTAYDTQTNPILVYSLSNNGLIFSSKSYGASNSAPIQEATNTTPSNPSDQSFA